MKTTCPAPLPRIPRKSATALWLLRARRAAWLLALILVPCSVSKQAFAQNIQFTQGSVGAGLDNSIQIPLRAYPGRGAASLPVTLYYSSKVWRVGNLDTVSNPSVYRSIAEAIYAEHSTAGWKSSLDVPKVEWPKESDQYYYSGGPYCFVCGSNARRFRVRRVYIHMPDGSAHELRENDQPYEGATDTVGTFYAVDGSRLRYDSAGPTTGTLFMPDGSRYVLNTTDAEGQSVNRFIDRHGNALTHYVATRQWKDVMGRVIGMPLPASPQAQDYTYTLPGLGGTPMSYTLRWERLEDALTPVGGQTPAMKSIANDYLPSPSQPPTNVNGQNYPQRLVSGIPFGNWPSLFISAQPSDEAEETFVVGRGQVGGEAFNPVVLTRVILPNGLSYEFSYNVYGEIDKVVYPTGGSDLYEYGEVPSVGGVLAPHSQANRGVKSRRLSARGDWTDTAQWTYTVAHAPNPVNPTGLVITTKSPDSTYTEVYKHNIRPPAQTGTHSNPRYWAFGFESAINGMAYEERVYAPDGSGQKGALLRRSLTEYETTTNEVQPPIPLLSNEKEHAYRNPRAKRGVSLILDTGGDAALAKTVTYHYDTTRQLTTGLDLTLMTESHFASVPQATAKEGALASIPAGPAASSSETAYLNDPDYLARNILGLVTSVVLKDAAGQAVSKTETFYDEADYPLLAPYADLDGDPGYLEQGLAVRGNPTTVRRYLGATASVPADQECEAGVCLETHAQFDRCGNPVNFWNERGVQSQKEYSADYKRAYLTKATTAAPDPSGQHGSDTGFTSESIYDETTGLVLSAKDANGQTTQFSYRDGQNNLDPLNRLRKVTRPDGGWTKNSFNDVVGNLYAHTETQLDAARSTHAYQFFDGLGRAARSYGLEAGQTYVVTDTEYDTSGRVKRSSNPFRTTIAATGNPSQPGYWATASQAAHWTSNTYDALGRVRIVTLPDETTVHTGYDGIYTTVTDQAGKQRRQKADALGRVVRVDEPDANGSLGGGFDSPAQPSFYEYDTLGNVVRINQGLTQSGSDPESAASYTQHRYFKYDALSRLTHERHVEQDGTINQPDALTGNSAWSRRLVYDEEGVAGQNYMGLLTSATDARGVLTRFDYDRLSRAYQVTYSDDTPAVTNTYDQEHAGYFNLGRLAEVRTAETDDAPATAQAYDYDRMGRIRSHRQTVGAHAYTMSYDFGLGGQLASQTYPSGRVVNYAYDPSARLSAVTSGATTYAGGITYKPFGGLESMTLGNGAVYSMGYDEARLQLSAISLTKGAETLQRYEYAYGRVDAATGAVDAAKNNGQVGRVEGFIGSQKQWQQRFSYDTLGRLSSAKEVRGDDSQQSYLLDYDYDAYGNRSQKSLSNQDNPVAQHWVEGGSFDPLTNRFASGVTYDAAGNVTSDSRFRHRSYLYDANGRQRRSSNPDGSDAVVSVYDGAGQRVATKAGGVLSAVFVYDASGVLAAEYGVGAPVPAGTQYVVGDHQGSTRVVMNATGANGGVVSRRDYLPFGEEVSAGVGMRSAAQGYGQADGVRQRYAGMEGDEATGMSHTLWRKFDSSSARWTSPDPYGGSMDISSPQSFNRYTYVNNDPVNKVDPTGLMLSDIGVYQTENAAVAGRLERAMVTYGRRYAEGQTARAQRQQTQQNNARFMGAANSAAISEASTALFGDVTSQQSPTPTPSNEGQPLSPCAMKLLEPIFSSSRLDISEIRLIETGIPSIMKKGAELFGGIIPGAVTIGTNIYTEPGFWQGQYKANPVEALALQGHEVWHSLQVKEYGRFLGTAGFADMYYTESARQWLRGKHSYHDNIYEKEAVKAQGYIKDWIKTFGPNPCASIGLPFR